jgi:hypothetical protein
MKTNWATQWFKLAGALLGVVAAIAFALVFVASLLDGHAPTFDDLFGAAGAFCYYASIPIATFTTFIIACRAFGKK